MILCYNSLLNFRRNIMGWNAGYRIFEQTVIGAYDLGKLDKNLLSVLLEPYRGSDIDHGGCKYLKSHDGKSVEQIVIETWGLKVPVAPTDLNKESEEWEVYREEVYSQFYSVTKNFGW